MVLLWHNGFEAPLFFKCIYIYCIDIKVKLYNLLTFVNTFVNMN